MLRVYPSPYLVDAPRICTSEKLNYEARAHLPIISEAREILKWKKGYLLRRQDV